MATPMSADQYLNALLAEGLKVREHDGWKTHNRNHRGPWGPLNGVMIHHTAGSEAGSSSFLYNGSSSLPGPLCHGAIHKDGVVECISWGRANHAGGGDPDTLAATISETYPVPAPNTHDGGDGSVDGNARYVGYECVNLGDGKDPWPSIQLEAIARASAAVCRFYGWSVNSVIRHKDWSDWKSDPRGIDWNRMRTRIATILNGKPNATKFEAAAWDTNGNNGTPVKPAPKPVPVKPVVDVSNILDAYYKDRPARTGHKSHPDDVKLVEAALDKLNFLSPKYAKDGSYGTKTEDAFNAFRRSIGLIGADATGAPGKYSLTELGKRSGLFTVKD